MSATSDNIQNADFTPGAAPAGSAETPPETGASTASAPASPPAGPPSGASDREPKASGAQAAYERVKARKQAGAQNTTGVSVQTPGGESPPGASTQAADDKPPAGTETAPAGAGSGAESTTPGSTVEPPEDWPADQKERFQALDAAAKGQVLGFYQDMHKGFSESMNKLASLRKQDEALFSTLRERGAGAEDVQRLLAMDAEYRQEPKKLLQRLAAQAGVEVYFERPLAPGEIPEFKDATEMAQWVSKQVQDQLRQEREADDQRRRQEAERADAKRRLEDEFRAVAAQAGKDWAAHKDAVIEKLSTHPELAVADAYALVTLPALRQLAEEGAAAKKELAELKARMETERKKQTQPPAGPRGREQEQEDKTLSPGQRAYRRALAKKQAAANAGAAA